MFEDGYFYDGGNKTFDVSVDSSADCNVQCKMTKNCFVSSYNASLSLCSLFIPKYRTYRYTAGPGTMHTQRSKYPHKMVAFMDY